jgi:hypothetical protein
VQLLDKALLSGRLQAVEAGIIAQQPLLVLHGKALVPIEPVPKMSRRKSAGIGGSWPPGIGIGRTGVGRTLSAIPGAVCRESWRHTLPAAISRALLVRALPVLVLSLLILERPLLVLVRPLLVLVLPRLILVLPLLIRLPVRAGLGLSHSRLRLRSLTRTATLAGSLDRSQTEEQDHCGGRRRTHSFRV